VDLLIQKLAAMTLAHAVLEKSISIAMENLEERIKKIEERNEAVEIDKAWEVSYTRKFLILIFTYLVIGLYLSAINIERPWINAIVPAIGFMLSTLTMPFFKKLWIKHSAGNKEQ
jgi:hypothetical protein